MAGLAETAELTARMTLEDGVTNPATKMKKQVSALDVQFAKLKTGVGKIGRGLALGLKRSAFIAGAGVAFLVLQLNKGLDSLGELEDLNAQTVAGLKATKAASGQTAQSIRDLANEYEDLTTVDDKVIQGAENILLTFKNVGKDAFEPALEAALNLSKALGTDLNSATKSLGKALNDPVAGLAKLTRLGVSFTEQEKAQIAELVKHGKTLQAQKLILGKLSDLYGGRAAASANTYRGIQARLHDAVEELQITLATALAPAISKVSKKLSEFLKDKAVIARVKELGDTLAGFLSDENIETGAKAVRGFFQGLADLPWDVIKQGFKISADAAREAYQIFSSLPPGVQGALITLLAANKLTGGLVASGLKDIAGLALSSLKTITAANVTVIGANVTGGGVPSVNAPSTDSGGLAGLVARVAAIAIPLAAIGLSVQGDQGPGGRAAVPTQGEIDISNAIALLTQRQGVGFQGISDVLSHLNVHDPQVINVIKALNGGLINDDQANEILGDIARGVPTLDKTLNGIRGGIGGVAHGTTAVKGAVSALLAPLRLTAQTSDTLTDQGKAAYRQREQQKNRLDAIARKRTSINVKTTFSVSAREIAQQVQHISAQHGSTPI